MSQIQKSWESLKRLDRLAPTLVHICGFIWEWTQAKSKSPLNTPGGISGRGGRGHKFKSLGKLSNGCTDWHQIWYTSGNGHRLNTIRATIPQGHLGEIRGSPIQMFGEPVKRLERLASNLVQICGFVWEST